VQAPLDEVFAVVAEQAVTLLAEARTCAPDDLVGRVTGLAVFDHEHGPTTGEFLERHFFHRLAHDVVHQRAVVNYAAVARVDAVMRKTQEGCHQVRARFRRLSGRQLENDATRDARIDVVGAELEARKLGNCSVVVRVVGHGRRCVFS